MSTTTETIKTLKLNGVLTDADSAKITVTRTDTSAVVVDNADMTRLSTGRYYHSWIDPTYDLTYSIDVAFTVGGETYPAATYTLAGTVTPTTYPISLDEAKEHLRITLTDEDDYITSLIEAATQWCEAYENRVYVPRNVAECFNDFSDLTLRDNPVQSISSITYIDDNGDSQTLSTDVYGLDDASCPAYVYLKYGQSWPTVYNRPNAVTVNYTAGYSDISGRVKAAVQLMLAHLYEHREASSEVNLNNIPLGVKSLLSDRVFI